jgi:hypothetical protein
MEDSNIFDTEKKKLLKLYNSVPIDNDKISKVGEQPTSYQWELVRQNIKYIVRFLDKLQIYIGNLLVKNKNTFAKNNYQYLIDVWDEFGDEEYEEYEYLVKILSISSEDTIKYLRGKGGDNFFNEYFYEMRKIFSDKYEDIISSWDKCIVDEIKFNVLGNGQLMMSDPFCSKQINDLLFNVVTKFQEYVNKTKTVSNLLENKKVKIFTLASSILMPLGLIGGFFYMRKK